MASENGGREGKSFDPHTFIRLNDVRKDVWNGGLKGLLCGLAIGSTMHIFTHYIPKLKKYKHNNYFVFTTLLLGSLGSFLGSVVSGKNSVQYIGDIFRMNSSPSSPYLARLQQNDEEIHTSADESFIRREQAIRIKKADPKY